MKINFVLYYYNNFDDIGYCDTTDSRYHRYMSNDLIQSWQILTQEDQELVALIGSSLTISPEEAVKIELAINKMSDIQQTQLRALLNEKISPR